MRPIARSAAVASERGRVRYISRHVEMHAFFLTVATYRIGFFLFLICRFISLSLKQVRCIK